MTNKLIGGTVAVVLLVFALLWKHDGDVRRDGRIEELTRQVTLDSIALQAVVRRNDSLSQQADTAATALAKVDTVWRRHSDTITATVHQIVTSVVPDSEKIKELAALVLATKQKADSLEAASARAAKLELDLRTGFADERSGWQTERRDMATKITLLEKQSRHWGLCGSAGYGPQREHDGAIRLGVNASVGVCYRY